MILTSYQEKALREMVKAFYPVYTNKEIEKMSLEVVIELVKLAI